MAIEWAKILEYSNILNMGFQKVIIGSEIVSNIWSIVIFIAHYSVEKLFGMIC